MLPITSIANAMQDFKGTVTNALLSTDIRLMTTVSKESKVNIELKTVQYQNIFQMNVHLRSIALETLNAFWIKALKNTSAYVTRVTLKIPYQELASTKG